MELAKSAMFPISESHKHVPTGDPFGRGNLKVDVQGTIWKDTLRIPATHDVSIEGMSISIGMPSYSTSWNADGTPAPNKTGFVPGVWGDYGGAVGFERGSTYM